MEPTVPKRDSLRVGIDDIAPSLDGYRLSIPNARIALKRPSLDILHESASVNDLDVIALNEQLSSPSSAPIDSPIEVRVPEVSQGQVKFGWIRGVLIRCILSILGTLIFLRLSWVAGQAGILLGVVIALLSTLIVVITALSMCALCTNGEINAGGAYFMLSRSLGPEFGGSMGVVFALADAVACAMNVVGFAESMRDLLYSYGLSIIDPDNDVRIIGAITMVCLWIIVMISVSWEAKTELVLLVIVITAYTNFLVGTLLPVGDDKRAKGVTGYTWSTFKENLMPGFTGGENFITIFAIYFPSITGIMAGAGISGELKAPDKALPKGTLLGIAITSLVYISAIVLTGASVLRDASGDINDITGCKNFGNCSYGLLNDYNVMSIESGYWALVTAGTFATSLSSALTLIVTSPRTIQALTRDRLYPYVHFLSIESGRDREPRIAYCLVLLIGLVIVAIGNLNVIAPLISNFYLASFALINYACFDGSLAKSPNWRPAFKYYNMWIALFGALLCVVAMFVMQYITALATIAVMFFLYVYILRSKPNVNWGSSGQAHMYKNALQYMLSLVYTEEHVKTYRPSILLLSGNPVIRPCLVNFFANITKGRSLYICGDVFISQNLDDVADDMRRRSRKIQYWLKKRKIKTFHCPLVAPSTDEGYKALLQLSGFGKMRPNIVALGFKRNWKQASFLEIDEYFALIHEIFTQNMGICLLAQRIGFDFSEQIEKGKTAEQYVDLLHRGSIPVAVNGMLNPYQDPRSPTTPKDDGIFFTPNSNRISATPSSSLQRRNVPPTLDIRNENSRIQFALDNMSQGSMSRQTSYSSLSRDSITPETPTIVINDQKPMRKKSQFQRELDFALEQFTVKIKKGVVDVWWLFDDGGLTLLLAHLITTKKSYLSGASLRIFTFAQNVENIAQEKANMESLLEKFRIKFSEVTVIGDLSKPAAPWTTAEFERIVDKFNATSKETLPDYPKVIVTDEKLEELSDKTHLFLRTREEVMSLSKDSDLIVITIPIPRKDRETAAVYLAWLEMLSRDLSPTDPPVLLVRGNQENVLTFYS